MRSWSYSLLQLCWLVWGLSDGKLDSVNHLKFISNNFIVFPKALLLSWIIWHPVEEVRAHVGPVLLMNLSSIWNGLDPYLLQSPLMTLDIWRPGDSFSALAHYHTFRPRKIRREKVIEKKFIFFRMSLIKQTLHTVDYKSEFLPVWPGSLLANTCVPPAILMVTTWSSTLLWTMSSHWLEKDKCLSWHFLGFKFFFKLSSFSLASRCLLLYY